LWKAILCTVPDGTSQPWGDNMAFMKKLSKEDLLHGLQSLDEKAKKANIVVDISVYGGAALVLGYDLERSTRDVDVVIGSSISLVRELAAQVAQENHWHESWLNDGVKGFVSSHEAMQPLPEFNAEKEGGIRIYTPAPEYLFAMKCMAMRKDFDDVHDIEDIEFLADVANIKDVDSALKIIESFYPAERIPAKVAFGVQEIMERKLAARQSVEVAEKKPRQERQPGKAEQEGKADEPARRRSGKRDLER